MSEMIKLKIDGIDVEVPKGTTILQAAKQANIDIPTLCYLKEINEKKVLTYEEEQELFKKYENKDKTARKKIIESNLRLVVNIARKFMNQKFESVTLKLVILDL